MEFIYSPTVILNATEGVEIGVTVPESSNITFVEVIKLYLSF
jgi:hypothetical protein